MKRTSRPIEPEHLPLAVLRRYQEGELPASEEHRVERHVLHCPLCSDLLEAMADQPASQSAAAALDLNQRVAAVVAERKRKVIPLAGWRNLGVAAALLLLILSGIVVVYHNLERARLGTKEPFATTKPERAGNPANSAPPEVAVLKPAPVLADTIQADRPAPIAGNLDNRLRRKPLAAADKMGPTGPGGEKEVAVVLPVPTLIQDDVVLRDTTAQTLSPAAPAAASPERALAGRVAGVSVQKETHAERPLRIRGIASTPPATAGRLVVGRVLDSEGQGIPGVTVLIKGTTTGTATDADGNYTLNLPNALEDLTLTYSFIGYATLEKKIKGEAVAAVNVTLEADEKTLSEVVVTGYGTQNRAEQNNAVVPARPQGGKSAFRKYLENSLRYPAAARQQKIQGRVVLAFTVEANGQLSGLRVVRSLSPECDAEALRLVREGPAWQPGQAGGQPVPQQVRVTVRFKL